MNSLLSTLVGQICTLDSSANKAPTIKLQESDCESILDYIEDYPWSTVQEIATALETTYKWVWRRIEILEDSKLIDIRYTYRRFATSVHKSKIVAMSGTKPDYPDDGREEMWRKIRELYYFDVVSRTLYYKDRKSFTFKTESAYKVWLIKCRGQRAGHYTDNSVTLKVDDTAYTISLNDPRILELDRWDARKRAI